MHAIGAHRLDLQTDESNDSILFARSPRKVRLSSTLGKRTRCKGHLQCQFESKLTNFSFYVYLFTSTFVCLICVCNNV